MRVDVADLKAAAKGREVEILVSVAGIPQELLDGRPHACPKCQGGVDRFRLLDAKTGAVRCNQCFSEKCGDFVSAIQWMTGRTFPEAVSAAALFLGLRGTRQDTDVLEAFCRAKNILPESLKAFGATTTKRGSDTVARVPMYDERYQQVGYQDFGVSGSLSKGLTGRGCKSGLFLTRLPVPGETVVSVEGVKDAAALHAIGFVSAGTPGTVFKAAWARVFYGCRVVLIPDRDEASYKHFGRIRKLLTGVAAVVRQIDLPFPMEESGGKDTRDFLQQDGGELALCELIREALALDGKNDSLVELNCNVLKAAYSGRWTAEELVAKQIKRLKELT